MTLASQFTPSLVTAAALLCVAAAPASQPSNPDQKFMMSAARDGLKEVALGRLATNQGDSEDVRACGRMMVTDHTAANDRLLTIAVQENLTPPKDLSADDQAAYDKLAALHGKAFDQAFLTAMISDHTADIAATQKELDAGLAAAVKDWARNTLTVLKHHLTMVLDVNTKLGT